jgi:hypothetical protein
MEKLKELVPGYPGLISPRLINRGMTKRFGANIYYTETNSPVQPSSDPDFIYG